LHTLNCPPTINIQLSRTFFASLKQQPWQISPFLKNIKRQKFSHAKNPKRYGIAAKGTKRSKHALGLFAVPHVQQV
jgi:hypothetical protein